MRLDASMSMRTEQKMILAPRMIQSMEILQLAVMALQERIDQEMQENPVLELKEDSGEDEPGSEGAAELEVLDESTLGDERADVADPEKELVIDSNGGNEEDFDRLLAINEDWADHFNEEHRPSSNRVDEDMDKKHDAMVNMASRAQSLQEYLYDQLAFVAADEELELARFILTHMDDNGYLTTSLEIIGQNYSRPVDADQLEDALAIIQKLDPPGVGARDLMECLLLQVTTDTPYREVVRSLILNHLEDIQHNRLPVIQKRTGFSIDTIHEAIEVLKHLNPKPGSQFQSKSVPYVVPDIIIERDESGEYTIRLVDDWTPNVRVSHRYLQMYHDRNADAQAKEFLKRKILAARWLIEAIEQRRSTLTKVTRAIIQHQRAFLDRGPEYIEPLKMQQIADQVGVHVTTVSRAVDDKWVQTPRGVFPLKRFFGGGTQTANGEEVAWETIKQKLLDIIANEDKSNPLSDEDLVAKLSEASYPVARRTVTKYRKMLNIQSSRQRKVWS